MLNKTTANQSQFPAQTRGGPFPSSVTSSSTSGGQSPWPNFAPLQAFSAVVATGPRPAPPPYVAPPFLSLLPVGLSGPRGYAAAAAKPQPAPPRPVTPPPIDLVASAIAAYDFGESVKWIQPILLKFRADVGDRKWTKGDAVALKERLFPKGWGNAYTTSNFAFEQARAVIAAVRSSCVAVSAQFIVELNSYAGMSIPKFKTAMGLTGSTHLRPEDIVNFRSYLGKLR